MSSPALLPGSSSLRSVATKSLLKIMSNAEGGEEKLLLRENSSFNVPVKRRFFPKESSAHLRKALDGVLALALSLQTSSLLAFSLHAVT